MFQLSSGSILPVLTIIILYHGIISSWVSAEDEIPDDEFIKRYDEVALKTACDAMSASDPLLFKLNLSRTISMEDVVKMTFWNKGKKLEATILDFPEDIQWKRKLVNLLFDIFKDACPALYVRYEYLNIMREFVMIYLNSVEPRDSQQMNVWEVITNSLDECDKLDLPPHNFTTKGLLIDSMIVNEGPAGEGGEGVKTNQDGGWAADDEDNDDDDDEGSPSQNETSLIELSPQLETADQIFELDLVIETLWTVFSHAWSRCYPTAPSKELWGPRFKQLFFRDFLASLEERWQTPGSLKFYMDTIIGDFDLLRMLFNIDYCLDATYFTSGLTNQQLVRPIRLADISEGIAQTQNHKVSHGESE